MSNDPSKTVVDQCKLLKKAGSISSKLIREGSTNQFSKNSGMNEWNPEGPKLKPYHLVKHIDSSYNSMNRRGIYEDTYDEIIIESYILKGDHLYAVALERTNECGSSTKYKIKLVDADDIVFVDANVNMK
jgi:hypothetical protein